MKHDAMRREGENESSTMRAGNLSVEREVTGKRIVAAVLLDEIEGVPVLQGFYAFGDLRAVDAHAEDLLRGPGRRRHIPSIRPDTTNPLYRTRRGAACGQVAKFCPPDPRMPTQREAPPAEWDG
jgi:hypothetical protein